MWGQHGFSRMGPFGSEATGGLRGFAGFRRGAPGLPVDFTPNVPPDLPPDLPLGFAPSLLPGLLPGLSAGAGRPRSDREGVGFFIVG